MSMRGDDIKTVADLLPYEQISNNLIFLKNGSIAFGFELAGFCAETKTGRAERTASQLTLIAKLTSGRCGGLSGLLCAQQ
jgi:hypothetical protein